MVDLRERYDSDFFNAMSFGALCHDKGVDPMDGLRFTIKECREREIRNPQTNRTELGHVIEFWEHRKLLIISNANSGELFWCIGSETETYPEMRIKLCLVDGNKKNPYWLRVKAEKIPAASDPFMPNVAEGIDKRLIEVGGSGEGFIAWAKEHRLLILDRFPSNMASYNPENWCLGMLEDITEYANIVKRASDLAAQTAAAAAAEEAKNATPEPTEAELPTRDPQPATGQQPVRASEVEITEDDIPF